MPDEPRLLAGIPGNAPAVLFPAPEQLAGYPVRLPKTREMMRVFGEPAKFQRGVVDFDYRLQDAWDPDPLRGNNWAPSSWRRSTIDSDWVPQESFESR